MRRRKKSRQWDVFNLSFLDSICCGFGAVILLFVLSKAAEPMVIEASREDLSGLIRELQEQLFELQGEVTVLNRDLEGKREQLSEETEQLARLQGDLSDLRGEFDASKDMAQVQNIIEGQLAAARQTLTEDMKALLARLNRPEQVDQPIAGVPMDSQYVIFVIDTSGSMVQGAWSQMLRKMEEILDAYPDLKGMQVMNDMGQYMFPAYAGQWIPDTPARRRAVMGVLRSWFPFSNSSPVEGIQEALRRHATEGEKMSIYVMGDEFSVGNMDTVLDRVDRLNRKADGTLRARIHAIGFPVVIRGHIGSGNTGLRYAILMREMTRRNGGTFVGLPQ
ncbi:MAG: VWA domain-containing protein [Verrucomicrobia bacterium]|nr:VWA domain-containing protein [Verrucomicrobiota bacterium]MCH8513284.1 VWA domain-containing protein [Kiritimatiellia bacterium]